ncbi:MAG: helix-turn-helix transcriptional regulator [Chloroflexi bacterium]|nr:helix-turn-helix transcriptional regulator [Chloroflexota bacterium]
MGQTVRIRIMFALFEHNSRSVNELKDHIGLPQPLVSHHLRSLSAVGIVVGERKGREVRYRLIDDHIWHIVRDAIKHSGEKR